MLPLSFSLVNPPDLALPVAQTTAMVRASLAPAVSAPTGRSALTALIATTRPTQIALAARLVAAAALVVALVVAPAVLLEARTTVMGRA